MPESREGRSVCPTCGSPVREVIAANGTATYEPDGVERLTPHEARALRLASIFGTPDPTPAEIESALRKIKAIEATDA